MLKTSVSELLLNLVFYSILVEVEDVLTFSFQKILAKNDVGEHFPVLAICLGFELLTMIISKVILVSLLNVT